ncbi:acyl-CoA reductase [Aminiphilus circumscriptus]|uniref:acyl-CoA reductase n=1 Tax=Aminiphilus circumscriptus TaxID=290732 RepID=UPI0004785DC9|nr:acyl-CoA reductase [Aminiphilus circumscriptus]
MEATQRHYLFGEFLELPQDLPEATAARFFNETFLAERSRAFAAVPVDDVLGVLHRTGRLLVDPKGSYRRRILENMPAVTGYSPALVEKGVEVLGTLLSRTFLQERLSCLGNYRALDCFVPWGRGKLSRAVPLGAVCHVAAGNIFLGSVDSLVLGISTKNVNVLKISRQDPLFPFLFLEALLEADPKGLVAPYLAVTSWSRRNAAVVSLVKRVFDGILLFGGEDAVREYKKDLAPKTQLLAFGPKISFGVVTEGLDDEELREAAKGFALDVTLWEQRACTSCQNVFVEDAGADASDLFGDDSSYVVRFSRYFADALAEQAKVFPPGRAELDELVEIRKERELAAWKSFQGKARLFEVAGGDATVILQEGADVVPSPLNRTVYVNRVRRLEDVTEGNLRVMGYYMSTVGLAAPEERLQSSLEAMLGLGVLRFCRPGTMGLGADPSAPHDGVFIPLQLVRFVNREDISPDLLGQDFLFRESRDRELLARINAILETATASPFYRERYASRALSLPLASLDDLKNVPFLEKADLAAHCPPFDMTMLTREPRGAYFFASGGTSGKPRYVAWSAEEFDLAGHLTGRGFRMLGIGPEDTVANLLRAGALWTGFLAFDRALEETGCRILSMTYNQSDEETLEMLATFRPTAIMAMSSALVSLAEAVERTGWSGSVPKVFFTGEPLPESAREYVSRLFRSECIASPLYGAVEIGPMGYQCPHCSPTEFHVTDEWCYMELMEDGEIVATTLERHLHPLIRYRLGDRAEWVAGACACGSRSPRFRLLGRTDDYVRVHFGKLYLEEVAQALRAFPELSSDFQIVVDPLGERARVTFTVESLPGRLSGLPRTQESRDTRDTVELERRICDAIIAKAKVYADPRNLKLEELVARVVPPQSIPRVERTGKIRRIVDRRV